MHHSQLPKDVESLKRDQYLCCSRLKIAQPRSFRSHYENVSHEIARDHIEYSTSQSGRRDSTDRVDTSRESSNALCIRTFISREREEGADI
jgi:hypothetical protein